jgi:hypothetical protein
MDETRIIGNVDGQINDEFEYVRYELVEIFHEVAADRLEDNQAK